MIRIAIAKEVLRELISSFLRWFAACSVPNLQQWDLLHPNQTHPAISHPFRSCIHTFSFRSSPSITTRTHNTHTHTTNLPTTTTTKMGNCISLANNNIPPKVRRRSKSGKTFKNYGDPSLIGVYSSRGFPKYPHPSRRGSAADSRRRGHTSSRSSRAGSPRSSIGEGEERVVDV